MKKISQLITLLSAILLGLNVGVADDGSSKDSVAESTAQKPAQQKKGPPKFPVGFITVHPKTIEVTKNLPGRLVAVRDAVVRARVTGIVESKLFKEGTYVRAGQQLFRIDDRQFRANLASAKAQLAQAQANQTLALGNVKRYRSLLKSKAVSQQTYDQAKAQLASAKAAIETAKAAITQAQLYIEYANVTAPISGYIGQANVTEGSLVSAATSTVLAQIQQVDPLYIDIKQPATQIINIKKLLIENGVEIKDLEKMGIDVKVFFDDGTSYTHTGKLLFANVNVDPITGNASLRAELPNPDHLLMPGLYMRAEVPQAKIEKAVLLPQQAVTRGGKMDTVFVLNDDDTYAPRPITVMQSQNNQWLVSDGLKDGDKVIVDGMQKVLMMRLKTVTPVPFGAKPQSKQK
ncbi:MAG: efflux RND transporter periplasmic adaptor subunit [Gammaproteobacteria bacterium]|nr:efflux RND transporter periplasmic adaptor subunit [Gammaproteobacteria bacterium]